ncbi:MULTISPECIES: ABC transporter permease [unclassified Undibacterium]|uniref:ABC transporter permease n=1 Tax=unclassified Undibacterium TaxID=2630295 RepID=UPI002AC9D04F|nr:MULTISPECIES: ABC transporter permease [unclassified Undibacterium]MEB0138304.1 ABC transporter permease [Undibacterium sp. CCC2.1]MEB0170790.1 ABC transporter permease [Undibacterium sp. CCC1.1]MEB0174679.1 ABC transporter permease [Undibacterium sp. CCC3.4]MEB0213876.1 ABC transporter permease [Undibacterium sp. 5I2]WPX42602.1 ABC transporter permease [Undibacterium sp. CCC3.4]
MDTLPPTPTKSRLLKSFFSSKTARMASALLFLLVLSSLAAGWLSPQNPYDLAQVSFADAEQAPGAMSHDGKLFFLLGTDGAGRDLFSAILYGLRISLFIGISSALTALLIGTAIGLAAAYFGGKFDAFIMRIVDFQLSIPAILVALILLAALGQGIDKTLIALILVQWAYFARHVRASASVERRKEYIEAAMSQALPARTIMFRHILPNCAGSLIVTATLQMAHAISLEATMSFLGLGLPQTEPSLGLLIANGFDYLLSNQYWISVFPGIALMLLIGTINLLGDRLRIVVNPKTE